MHFSSQKTFQFAEITAVSKQAPQNEMLQRQNIYMILNNYNVYFSIANEIHNAILMVVGTILVNHGTLQTKHKAQLSMESSFQVTGNRQVFIKDKISDFLKHPTYISYNDSSK